MYIFCVDRRSKNYTPKGKGKLPGQSDSWKITGSLLTVVSVSSNRRIAQSRVTSPFGDTVSNVLMRSTRAMQRRSTKVAVCRAITGRSDTDGWLRYFEDVTTPPDMTLLALLESVCARIADLVNIEPTHEAKLMQLLSQTITIPPPSHVEQPPNIETGTSQLNRACLWPTIYTCTIPWSTRQGPI